MTVQESKFISFNYNSVETEGLFKDLTLKYLSHVSYRDADGEIISKESFTARIIQNIEKYIESYQIIEDFIKVQRNNGSKRFVKMVNKNQLDKQAKFGVGEKYIFGFLEEEFKSRKYIFIMEADVLHYIHFNILVHKLIDNFYPVAKFYANEARTDGALFLEGEQPSGYTICDSSEMYSGDMD